MGGEHFSRQALITVKTYPEPSSKYRETVCTAAITREEGWVRLYPISFRDLPFNQQFKKYQLVELQMTKHDQDSRPESYRPDVDSIALNRVIQPGSDWSERKDWVLPTLSASMCEIQKRQKESGMSLGAFRPREIIDLAIEPASPEWTGKQKARIDQGWLADLEKPLELEKIPFIFKYHYVCDEPGCPGHSQTIIDWEIQQLYRNVRDRAGGDELEIRSKIREKYIDTICAPDRDVILFVGNMAKWRHVFLVIGVFYPPKAPPGLFS